MCFFVPTFAPSRSMHSLDMQLNDDMDLLG
jgi:hypothetical protein